MIRDGVFHNTCPRGCYGTCSILSYVKNGKLVKVTGNPKQGFSQGKLCAKGYASTEFVYHRERLKYPMIQQPRGSRDWRRITWDEAYTIIAKKFIELNKRYQSNLATAFHKYHGNVGLLHYAVEGMFNSFGPHSKPVGSPCAMTGVTALQKSIGKAINPDPENMAKAKLIVLWGVNPSVTNVHQMKYIYEARHKGAIIVCIDPLFTKTAEKADFYVQINLGTDALLAHGIAKLLIESGHYSNEFLQNQTIGWEEYKQYVTEQSLTEISAQTGVSLEVIHTLAELYKKHKPIATWCGLGIQRTRNGEDIINSISTLVALTGNLLNPHGGFYYANSLDEFPNHLLNHQSPAHPFISNSREIDIANFASHGLALQNPPLKLLWVASINPLSQDHSFGAWEKLINQLELFVTVDLYMTKTAEQSDIVLPAASHFEADDLNISYWHLWLSINQRAIPPYYEAKSDLQIAQELTRKLNELSPGFSNFPAEKEPLDWIKDELSPEVKELYNINGYEDLLESPRKRRISGTILEEDRKFYCFSPKPSYNICDIKQGANPKSTEDEYRLLTPQSLLRMHSQFNHLTWLFNKQKSKFVELPSSAMKKYDLDEHSKVEIYTNAGSIVYSIKENPYLPTNVILADQAGENPINQIISIENIGNPGEVSTQFYDCKVKIRKWRGRGV